MRLLDGIIVGVSEGRYGDFSVRFRFKESDVTHEHRNLIKQLWREGDAVDLDIDLRPEESSPPKKQSLFQNFRFTVESDFGTEAYQKIKDRLGIEHLKELKDRFGDSEIENLLQDEIHNLRLTSGYFDKD